MRKNKLRTETMYIDITFFEWIPGDFELMEELDNNYLSDVHNLDRIKKFIIIDYLTQLNNDELSKMFVNFKSRKTIELEERKKQQEIEESQYYDDDFPF